MGTQSPHSERFGDEIRRWNENARGEKKIGGQRFPGKADYPRHPAATARAAAIAVGGGGRRTTPFVRRTLGGAGEKLPTFPRPRGGGCESGPLTTRSVSEKHAPARTMGPGLQRRRRSRTDRRRDRDRAGVTLREGRRRCEKKKETEINILRGIEIYIYIYIWWERVRGAGFRCILGRKWNKSETRSGIGKRKKELRLSILRASPSLASSPLRRALLEKPPFPTPPALV